MPLVVRITVRRGDFAEGTNAIVSRVAGLEKLIVHMKSKPGVWFATHEQIARYVKTNGQT